MTETTERTEETGPAGPEAHGEPGHERPGREQPGQEEPGDGDGRAEETADRRGGWSSLSDIQEAVGELVEGAIRNVAPPGGRFPRYDSYRMPGGGYRILFDLPGLEKSQVDVRVSGRELTISGVRPRPELAEGAEALRSERTYGRFRRMVRLPDGVDAERVGARMVNGVLEVELPARAPDEGQKIEID